MRLYRINDIKLYSSSALEKDFYSSGRGFESLRARHPKTNREFDPAPSSLLPCWYSLLDRVSLKI